MKPLFHLKILHCRWLTHHLSFPPLTSKNILFFTYVLIFFFLRVSFFFFFWCGPFSKSSLNLFQYSFCSMFWFLVFRCKACGIPSSTPSHDQGSNLNSTLYTGKWSPNHWKRSMSRLYIVILLFLTCMQSTSWATLGWKKHKLESRLPGEI